MGYLSISGPCESRRENAMTRGEAKRLIKRYDRTVALKRVEQKELKKRLEVLEKEIVDINELAWDLEQQFLLF